MTVPNYIYFLIQSLFVGGTFESQALRLTLSVLSPACFWCLWAVQNNLLWYSDLFPVHSQWKLCIVSTKYLRVRTFCLCNGEGDCRSTPNHGVSIFSFLQSSISSPPSRHQMLPPRCNCPTVLLQLKLLAPEQTNGCSGNERGQQHLSFHSSSPVYPSCNLAHLFWRLQFYFLTGGKKQVCVGNLGAPGWLSP